MTDWLRSRRAENGDEVNALETCFADRHHPRSYGYGKRQQKKQVLKLVDLR